MEEQGVAKMKRVAVKKDLVGTEICPQCGTVQDMLSQRAIPNATVWSMKAAKERGAKIRVEKRCPYCENEK